jgi:putative SOS response-associated peptidase YedK
MAKRNPTSRTEPEGSNKPVATMFAVVHRRVSTADGERKIEETLQELGPLWRTTNGHLRAVLLTTPLEWQDPRVHERVIIIVDRDREPSR